MLFWNTPTGPERNYCDDLLLHRRTTRSFQALPSAVPSVEMEKVEFGEGLYGYEIGSKTAPAVVVIQVELGPDLQSSTPFGRHDITLAGTLGNPTWLRRPSVSP